jgi:hypothetical protein
MSRSARLSWARRTRAVFASVQARQRQPPLVYVDTRPCALTSSSLSPSRWVDESSPTVCNTPSHYDRSSSV